MPAEENEAVVRRYIEECWNDHDLTNIDELVSPDYLNHAASPGHQHGIAAVKHVMNWLCAVFPDHRFDIEDAVAGGDRVAVRGACTGTHEGELWGITPTGRRFAAQQVHWFRVAGDKVAEHWGGTVEGNLVFEVPRGDGGIRMIYEPFERNVESVTLTL